MGTWLLGNQGHKIGGRGIMQRILVYMVLVILLLVSCQVENIESQPAEVVSLTQIPEHWGVGITDQNVYRPGVPSVSAVLIQEQYILGIDVDGIVVELQISPERFDILNIGDIVVYISDRRIIDD